MGMRDVFNQEMGIQPDVSHLNDNPLAVYGDESIMGDSARKFPFAFGHYFETQVSKQVLSDEIQKLFNDEVDAISAYENAAERLGKFYPDIVYIFRIIADEERNHRRILQDIQASVLEQTVN